MSTLRGLREICTRWFDMCLWVSYKQSWLFIARMRWGHKNCVMLGVACWWNNWRYNSIAEHHFHLPRTTSDYCRPFILTFGHFTLIAPQQKYLTYLQSRMKYLYHYRLQLVLIDITNKEYALNEVNFCKRSNAKCLSMLKELNECWSKQDVILFEKWLCQFT